MRLRRSAAPLAFLVLLAPLTAGALRGQAGTPGPPKEVGFDQKLGEAIPLDLAFRDEEGRELKLAECFGRKPVLLSLVYYECPMLCGMAMEGLTRSLRPLKFDAGKEFEVLTVSFDARETPALAAAKKQSVLAAYGREVAAGGWRFLTGEEEAIRALTRAVGFRYVWDEERKQFAHPTGAILLTPEGRISRYFFGIEYSPKDLRLGIIEAADAQIGSVADRLLLLCYQYDPKMGRYSLLAFSLLRSGAIVTVAILAGCIALWLYRERRTREG